MGLESTNPGFSHDFAEMPPPVGTENARRLLLVEDHVDSARAMTRLLNIAGYNVATALTVCDALRLADERTFDLVVCDIGLPDGTGDMLMRRLREEHGLHRIGLSGYSLNDASMDQSRRSIRHLPVKTGGAVDTAGGDQ